MDCEANWNNSSGTTQSCFEQVWKIGVQKKICHFTWRLIHGVIQTSSNIIRRGIKVDRGCKLCDHEYEDNKHLFTKCIRARQIWSRINISDLPDGESMEFRIWEAEAMNRLQENEKKLFCITLWEIWNLRNSVLFNGKAKENSQIISDIFERIEEFDAIQKDKDSSSSSVHSGWEKPGANWLKINFDGSFCEDSGHAGIGYVVRDESGQCVGAFCKQVQGCSNSHEVEAMALLEAAKFAGKMGIGNIMLEGDAKVVIEELENLRRGDAIEDISRAADFLLKAKTKLNGIDGVIVAWCRRLKNKAADCLASRGRFSLQALFFQDAFPDWLAEMLNYDVNRTPV